jgi:quercetin dioxygenase-like cupin family protein
VHAPAGTFVLVPPNLIHTFANTSVATVRWLNFHAPSTGFIASMRGDQDGFDSYDAPGPAGRDAADAIVSSAGPGEQGERDGLACAPLGHEQRFSAAELELAPGCSTAARTSADGVSAYFVLAGEVELALGGETVRAVRGTWVTAPAGVRHAFSNRTATPARMLHVCAPGREADG